MLRELMIHFCFFAFWDFGLSCVLLGSPGIRPPAVADSKNASIVDAILNRFLRLGRFWEATWGPQSMEMIEKSMLQCALNEILFEK